MAQPVCPSHAELSAFSLGELPEATLEEVAGHLERCARCEAVVRSLDHVSDPVIDSLRSLSGDDGPSLSGATPELPARVGEYEILGELGRGGMGIVYKARHTRLRRVVALKMLLGGEFAREGYRARFRAEAEAVARLQHPNIVQIFDTGEWRAADSGLLLTYFTLEYVEGGSLNTLLHGKPQSPDAAAELLLTLARAAHYAHGQGIVHRDLKPSNVLLTADGRPKLCDFGVAKVLAGEGLETLGDVLVGTPEYMAPEQADGQARTVGPTADVYALGAILYTMLTGRPPFRSSSVVETLVQVRTQEPVPPRQLRPSVPRDLETICLKCLQKDPRRRYPSASDLAEDLARFQGRRPILARPTGVIEQAWKRARRRPTEAFLISAVALVTLLGIALVFWQWRRAEVKAAAEAFANANAQRARQLAVQEQARMAFGQGLSLCEQGDVAQGLLWLARSLQLSTAARAEGLDRAIRINIADWSDQLSRPRSEFRHPAPVVDLAFRRDGRILASAGKDRRIRIWNTDSGEESGTPLDVEGATRRACRVAFSPTDDNMLAVADDGGRITFWDLARRRPLEPPLVHSEGHAIRGMAFTPDGRRLVTTSDRGTAHVWDVSGRKPVGGSIVLGDAAGRYPTALSPDGRTLVTGGGDLYAWRWDLDKGTRLEPPLLGDSRISALAYGRDGRRILAGTWDGRLRLCDPEARREFDLPTQGSAVSSVAVSPDGEVFATGTQGGVVRLWDTETLGRTGQTLLLVHPVTSLAFHPDGTILATGQDDGTIRLWGRPKSRALGPPRALDGPVAAVTFTPDGQHLGAATSSEVRRWDLARDRTEGTAIARNGRSSSDAPEPDEATAASPDGRLVATVRWAKAGGQAPARIELRDATSGNRLRESPDLAEPPIGLAFSLDAGRLLTWGAGSRSALFRETASLERATPLLRSLNVPIRQAEFRRDGKVLLLACQDGTARLWDIAKDEEINPGLHPHHGYPVAAVAFDPSGARVVTGCQDGTVGIWDVASGKLLFDVRGHAGQITTVTFSPDGDRLLTASQDGTARFWDTNSGKQLGPPLSHSDAVLSAAFHPDGQSVATGTGDGTVRRWRVPPNPGRGSVDEIRSRIEAQTGSWLDYQGAVHTLSLEQRKARGL